MVISQVISSFKNAEESSVCISIEGGGGERGAFQLQERGEHILALNSSYAVIEW